jgi:EAL domain-containing protein (putative c-di-GMP-specific phosphodiesterase class I)
MSASLAQPSSTAGAGREAEKNAGNPGIPLCFVVDADPSIRHFLSLVLHGVGVDTEEFADGHELPEALALRIPDVIFLNVALESAEAIETVVTLGKRAFAGYVQLMSGRGSAVLAHVKSVGEQHHLQMLPALKKPFDTGAVLKVLQEIKLGDPPAIAGRIDLEEALKKGWIEFWYQPKIDLRKKQLVGAEVCTRARHPQHGVLMPSAFLPGAQLPSLIAITEQAIARSLTAGLNFARLGVNLRLALDIPVEALAKVAVADIVESHKSKYDKWPGFIIDVSEEQILPELAFASELAKKLQPLNVTLAIDHFGRGYSALVRLTELPFSELKLDKTFVTDCGTDKVNAPLCKTVIDCAHNFGIVAVAVDIEKASDALALISMGCDYGQGFLLGQPMPEERFISLLRQRAGAPGGHGAPKPAAAVEPQPA